MTVIEKDAQTDKASLLIIGDSGDLYKNLVIGLEEKGLRVDYVKDTHQALSRLASPDYKAVVVAQARCEQLFRQISENFTQTEIHTHFIVVNDTLTEKSSLSALDKLSVTFLQKSLNIQTLERAIELITRLSGLSPIAKRAKTAAQTTDDQLSLLYDILSIIHQVRDYDLTVDMILDTLTEFLKVGKAALFLHDETTEIWKIAHARNLDEAFVRDFSFSSRQLLKEQKFPQEGYVKIGPAEAAPDANNQWKFDFGTMPHIWMFPLIFHEQMVGVILISSDEDLEQVNKELLNILRLFCGLLAPVMASFEKVNKNDYSLDSIINRIIRDRIQESRMLLSPTSFGIFRIILDHKPDDSILLSETVTGYQVFFRTEMRGKGDLIWLTLDTALLVFPKADLFTAETFCNNLKEKMENSFSTSDENYNLILKHICLSYPQSGKDAAEIINNLWLKLFEELSNKEEMLK
jgi:DNA-binding response OmpR family regulator